MQVEPSQSAGKNSTSKSKKKNKNRSNKSRHNGGTTQSNSIIENEENENDEAEVIDSPDMDAEPISSSVAVPNDDNEVNETQVDENTNSDSEHINGTNHAVLSNSTEEDSGNGVQEVETTDPERRLEAAAKERDQLRAEVTELRKSLQDIQKKHEEERSGLNTKLEEAQSGREHAEGQYQKLLGKVNTIKTQLGERLRADAADLAQARSQIEELEEQNRTVKENNESLQAQLVELNNEKEQQSTEISSLRGRTNLSQQNWAKERDDFVSREAKAREEFEAAKQAMQDWEVLAMEERSVREGLSERVSELEEQLLELKDSYDKASSEKDSQSATVDGLQRALQDIQEARRQELREVVENSQTQLEDLRGQLKASEESSKAAQATLETTKHELERALPFEKEVKEKNLLIGKLRHEAVILNDHLTKALRFLKKGKPEDNVDRQLVTNHLLHFLALDRSDPKKFQVLQLISALLGWTDEQNEAAGLARPGASNSSTNANSSLRVPLSPFRRVSSSASLSSGVNPSQPIGGTSFLSAPSKELPSSPNGRESLAELWNGFLEQDAQEGAATSTSRRTSLSTTATFSPTMSRRDELISPPPLDTPQLGTPRHTHSLSRSSSLQTGQSPTTGK